MRVGRLAILGLLTALLLPAAAGAKEFDTIVLVGTHGRSVTLHPSPAVIDHLFAGGQKKPAEGGYVRIFPLFRGFPGLPGRFYPLTSVVCMAWNEPLRVSSCPRVKGKLRKVLKAASEHVGRFHQRPTAVVSLGYGGQRVKRGNLNVAVEMALLRKRSRAEQRPKDCFHFTAEWRGPKAESRPRHVSLCRRSLRANGRGYPLSTDSLWQWAHLNLRRVEARRVEGTGGPDVLRGTKHRDGLHGRAGSDRLLGFAGNDSLYGEDGADVLFGNSGNDRFFGGRGRDLVYAGIGKDWASGGLGTDRVVGAAGDDHVSGGPGDDHLSGGNGADWLFGNAGNDFLNARDGKRSRRLADCLNAQGDACPLFTAGADYAEGGAGDDRILARDGRLDFITCGSGFDVVIADASDRFPYRNEPAACEVIREP